MVIPLVLSLSWQYFNIIRYKYLVYIPKIIKTELDLRLTAVQSQIAARESKAPTVWKQQWWLCSD